MAISLSVPVPLLKAYRDGRRCFVPHEKIANQARVVGPRSAALFRGISYDGTVKN